MEVVRYINFWADGVEGTGGPRRSGDGGNTGVNAGHMGVAGSEMSGE